MILRNTIIPSILLFTLVSVGCSPKQEQSECDSTKFDCTPKTEIVASEPIATVDEAVAIASQAASDAVDSAEEAIKTAPIANAEWKLDPKVEAKLPALFNKEIDPDFDWTVLESSLIEDGTYTGVDVIQVAMAYHHKQEPLVCNVDVIWEGLKVTVSLANRTTCIENYPNAS